MNTYKFPCGCELKILNDEINPHTGLPSLDIDYDKLPLDCLDTWQSFHNGNTKGVFQLETRLGTAWSKRVKPDSINDAAALTAVLRPGCISGDTLIWTRIWNKKNKRICYMKLSMRELFNRPKQPKMIISYNQDTGELIDNQILKIISSGNKEVFKVKLRKSIKRDALKAYNLECTIDHKVLTKNGWKEIGQLKIGERFIVIKKHSGNQPKKFITGKSYFKEICYQNYEYKCIFCDWKETSLDVNHIEGNRFTNNNPDNLCFMCPNHHRMYSNNILTKEQLIEARKPYILPKNDNIEWGEFLGLESLGIKDTYDISMNAPHHNFIAGNIIVHNCLEAKIEDKTVTQTYADRKNKLSPAIAIDTNIESCLENTYQVMIYQEQMMAIAKKIAGFNLVEVDKLRKSVGKKDQKLLAEVGEEFLKGCEKTGIVSKEKAEEIWNSIKASGRYLFNASHSVSYAYIAYWTAWVKVHFPLQFYTSWLTHAKHRLKPKEEIKELVSDAKYNSVTVRAPNLGMKPIPSDFKIYEKNIVFGLRDIKGIGNAQIVKLNAALDEAEKNYGNVSGWTWFEFLSRLSHKLGKTSMTALISVGGLDFFSLPRRLMLFEYNTWASLTDREIKFIGLAKLQHNNLLSALEYLATQKLTPKRIETVNGLVKTLRNPPSALEDSPIWINKTEQEMLGIPLSSAKVAGDAYDIDTTCREYSDGKQGTMVLSVEVDSIRENSIKSGPNKGDKMAFLEIKDDTATISAVAFSKEWTEYQNILYRGNTVVITGYRSKKDSFVINKVRQI